MSCTNLMYLANADYLLFAAAPSFHVEATSGQRYEKPLAADSNPAGQEVTDPTGLWEPVLKCWPHAVTARPTFDLA